MASKSLRNLRIVLWSLVLVAGAGAGWMVWQDRSPAIASQPTDTIGQGDYRLTATDGTPFTEATLKGKPSLVFFGFTHCPDVCPMTMGEISAWQEELGESAKDLRVYFVTVDPERDSAETLGDYVSWLPGTLGVTGTPEEMQKALKSFKIFARKVPGENGEYSMDHSAYVMVFDRDGRYSQIFGYQEPGAQVVEKLRRFLAEQAA